MKEPDDQGTRENNERKKMMKGSLRAVSAVDFKKKADTLTKQIYQLTTLCDVPACFILRAPDTEPYGKKYTWPESADEVRRVVGLFHSKAGNDGKRRTKIAGGGDVGLDESLKGMSTAQANNLLKEIDEKIDALKGKMENVELGSDRRRKKISSSDKISKPFSFDEELKEMTAAQAMILLSELDAKIESLTTKIDIEHGKRAKSSFPDEPTIETGKIGDYNAKQLLIMADSFVDYDDPSGTGSDYAEYNAAEAVSDPQMEDILVSLPTASVALVNNDPRRSKNSSSDKPTISRPFSFDEKLKEFTAAQAMTLLSELDAKIESLTAKIDNATSFPEKSSTIIEIGKSGEHNAMIMGDSFMDYDPSKTGYDYEEYHTAAAASDPQMDDILASLPTTSEDDVRMTTSELESDFFEFDSPLFDPPAFEIPQLDPASTVIGYECMEMEPASSPPVADPQNQDSLTLPSAPPAIITSSGDESGKGETTEMFEADLCPIFRGTEMSASWWDGYFEVVVDDDDDADLNLPAPAVVSPLRNDQLLFM